MSGIRILVISESNADFWVQLAIGFHAAGCHVSFTSLYDGLLDDLVAAEQSFDLIILNQQALFSFAIPIRDREPCDWKKYFKRFLVIQFHDVARELPTLLQAPYVFSRYDINVGYMIYCRESLNFIRTYNINCDYIFSDFPISFDFCLKFPIDTKVPYIKDLGDALVSRIPPPPLDGVLAFYPRILYFGSYFFSNAIFLSDDGPFKNIQEFRAAADEYIGLGKPLVRLGFIENLYKNGKITNNDFFTGRACECLYNYCCLTVLPVRLNYIRFMKERYGHEMHLYGDDWKNFDIEHFPSRFTKDDDYRSAFISVDFGSTYLDTSIYQRTIQILGSGGRLLQLRQPDAADVYGPFADHVCFDTPGQLGEKIDAALENPRQFLAEQAAFADYMRRRHDPETVCRNILQQLGY